ALVIDHFDFKVRMRIRPVEFFYDSLVSDLFRCIDAGGTVMCKQRNGETQHKHQGAGKAYNFHGSLLHYSCHFSRMLSGECTGGICSLRSGRHSTSAMSRSSWRSQCLTNFQSPTHILGSVSV